MRTTKQEYSAAPPLDVPINVSAAFLLPELFDVVAFANFFLTSLLKHDHSVLRGEFKNGVGYWFVQPLPDGEESEIGQQDSIGYFRIVLARFGYWYMAAQLYGGSAQRVLFYQARRHDCDITMSNDNRSGYSLTVYVKLRDT